VPTELRRVIFSNAELLQALSDYNKLPTHGGKLPPGTVGSCVVRDDPEGIVHLDIRDVDGNHTTVALPHAWVGAAMMRYCREIKIPLPKQSKKSLQVVGDNLTLCVEIHAGTQPLADPS
jgi:hypothetical protein